MKKRPMYFLADDKIDQSGEIFDYIAELHEYLWRFVRAVKPGTNGSLSDYVDSALEQLENKPLLDKPKAKEAE
ncbi:hypothetical protein LCGC14_1676130 [marine sediment metagenome]|uniref:Uncharacterized protein n=1 Tax=marine sediment metagenome TaxID=412755 RepID=A0A0F9HQM5_9ZZZZ